MNVSLLVSILGDAKRIETVPILPSPATLRRKIEAFADNGGGYFVIGYSHEDSKLVSAKDFYCAQILEKCAFDSAIVGTHGYRLIGGVEVYVIEVSASDTYKNSFVYIIEKK